MLKFFFGTTPFKPKPKAPKGVQRVNVYANGYGSKPFPNAYYNVNRGTV